MYGVNNKYFLIDFLWLLIIGCIYVFGNLSTSLIGKIIIIVAIISNIEMIWRYKNHDYIVLFFIFSLLYWLFLIAFYFYDIPYHYLLQYQSLYYTNQVVLMQVFMLKIMFFGINPRKLKSPREVLSSRKNNLIYYSLFYMLLVMLFIVLITLPPNLSTNYSLETKSSSWFEYSIIFFLIATVYADTQYKKKWLILLLVIYAFMPLLYGKRLAFIMLMLLLFNLFYSRRLTINKILIFSIVGFVFIRIVALYRVGIYNFTIAEFLIGVGDNGIMSNNQGGVVICSATYYGLIQDGIFDFLFRIKSLIGTFSNIILPTSINLEETYVNLVAMKVSQIPGNGGFPSIYLYIWGGFIGIFIGGLIFNYLMRKMQHSRLVAIYMIFVFATFPRWYAYNMLILLKLGFWLMFFLAIVDTYKKYTSKRIVNK